MATTSAPLCRVCRQHTAEYTCPRCNARYCSLGCYKRHSERCTEGFYRDAAVSELRSITSDADEKQRMMEILHRLHQQDLEGDDGGSSGGEDGDEPGGLSGQTLHRLLAKVQASGEAFDVTAEDLTPAELAAFHQALAAGELTGGVQPWEPWWLSEDAARLELSATGTALVAAVEESAAEAGGEAAGAAAAASGRQQLVVVQPQQEGGVASSGNGAPSAAGGTAAEGASVPVSSGGPLPPPPSRPLPPLSALTMAAPSPLLQFQLLDLLYAYCFTLRLYNGDYQWEAADAADILFAVSAVLAAVAPAAGSARRSSSSSQAGAAAGSGQDDGRSGSSSESAAAAPVLLGCVQRACQPPVGSRDSRGLAAGVVSDVAAVLQLGRPVVLTALMDATRLVEAAREHLEASSSGGDSSRSKQQRKELQRRLVSAQRKLLFFLAWANEQPEDAFELLALAAAAEYQKHAAAVGGQAAAGTGLEAQLSVAGHGGGGSSNAQQQQQRQQLWAGQAGGTPTLGTAAAAGSGAPRQTKTGSTMIEEL